MAATINLMTAIANTDIDIFVVLGKLPSDIVGLILDYLPKCMLHELLYFHLLEKLHLQFYQRC